MNNFTQNNQILPNRETTQDLTIIYPGMVYLFYEHFKAFWYVINVISRNHKVFLLLEPNVYFPKSSTGTETILRKTYLFFYVELNGSKIWGFVWMYMWHMAQTTR